MKAIPVLTLLSLLPLVAPAAEPSVKLAGIQIVFNDAEEEFDGFKTYNTGNGYGVTLLVRGDGRQIVAFDDDKATVKLGGASAKCRYFGGDSAFSKDRQTLRLEFESEACQITPDGKLKIGGEIPIVYATGKEETRSEAFKVAAGAEVKFAAAKAASMPTLKVKSSGKPKFGDGAFEVEITTNRKADEFAGIRFYTKDGKAVEAERTSTSWMGFGDKGSGEITYSFKAAQTDLILAVETWTGREEVKVKVDLMAGMAMPKP